MTTDGFTNKEILLEVKDDVKEVRSDVAEIKITLSPLATHEDRIRSLEKWRYGIPVSVISTVTALIVAVFH